jgi:hypothetical protein
MTRCDRVSYTLATALGGANQSATTSIFGGRYAFMADGTAGGATVSLQMQDPGGAWCPVAIMGLTALQTTALPFFASQVELPPGNVRVVATGGSGSSINAYLCGIG